MYTIVGWHTSKKLQCTSKQVHFLFMVRRRSCIPSMSRSMVREKLNEYGNDRTDADVEADRDGKKIVPESPFPLAGRAGDCLSLISVANREI